MGAVRSGGGTGAAGPAPDEPRPAAETEPADTGGVLPGTLPEIVPLPGDVRRAGGLVWWVEDACRARVLDVGSGVVSRLPGRVCAIRPAPSGALAVGLVDRLRGPAALLFSYPPGEGERQLDEGRELVGTTLDSPVAWDPGGERVAVCVGSAIDVLDVVAGGSSSVENACPAAFLGDGGLATVRSLASIDVDGRRLVGPDVGEALLAGVPAGARRFLVALGARRGRLVAGYVAAFPDEGVVVGSAVAVLAADGRVVFSLPLRPDTLPDRIGVSPAGDALWYRDAVTGLAVVLDVPGAGRRAPYRAEAVDWSPTAPFLAAAGPKGVTIGEWPGGHELAVFGRRAHDVAWTAAP